jgi:hypothetical protein
METWPKKTNPPSPEKGQRGQEGINAKPEAVSPEKESEKHREMNLATTGALIDVLKESAEDLRDATKILPLEKPAEIEQILSRLRSANEDAAWATSEAIRNSANTQKTLEAIEAVIRLKELEIKLLADPNPGERLKEEGMGGPAARAERYLEPLRSLQERTQKIIGLEAEKGMHQEEQVEDPQKVMFRAYREFREHGGITKRLAEIEERMKARDYPSNTETLEAVEEALELRKEYQQHASDYDLPTDFKWSLERLEQRAKMLRDIVKKAA